MQAKMLVCLSIMLVCLGSFAVANETIWIRSVHSNQTGSVSIVVDVPPDTKAEASQFRLIEDNKITATASSITPFSDSDWKLAIVFCVDKSGSINDAQLEETKSALKNLLRKPLFKQQDRLALVSFENEPRVIQWFTQSKEIYKKINELENMKGRHTVLYDTLFDSLGYVNSDSIDASPPVLKRILVITDGENDGGLRQNITEVREKALETGVAIDAVLLHAKTKSAVTMQSLANDTGGKFVNTESNGIGNALNQIFNEILGTYIVSFERSIGTASAKTANVGVEFQGLNEKPISDSVPARISQSAVDQTPSPDEPTPNWLWWYLVFLLLAALLAFVIWRSRQKTPSRPKVSEPNVEFDKKISTPAPLFPTSHESKRRKTLVGSYSSPISKPDSSIATLLCLSGPKEGQQFSMGKDSFHIGANPDNDLCITQDEYVSGKHASLRYEDGSLVLYDEGSRNGTFINDIQVTDTGTVLKPGEQIRIGTSIFEVAISVD